MRALRSSTFLIASIVATRLAAFEIEPREPTVCDDLTVVIDRTFDEDCDWSVTGEVHDDGSRIRVDLTLHRATTQCAIPLLPVEETFRVPIGSFAPGSYTVVISWTDAALPDEARDVVIEDALCIAGFRRGDADGRGDVDVGDAVAILHGLFLGAAIPCRDAADADASGEIEITDAVSVLDFLFLRGEPPAPPFRECGPGPADLPALGCERSPCVLAIRNEAQWMARPDGCVQCEPCDAPGLPAAVATLEEAGVAVLDSALDAVPVCLACSVCPSGVFYAVLVAAEDVETALAMGWGPWHEPRGRF